MAGRNNFARFSGAMAQWCSETVKKTIIGAMAPWKVEIFMLCFWAPRRHGGSETLKKKIEALLDKNQEINKITLVNILTDLLKD
jgi:hypothetical protein